MYNENIHNTLCDYIESYIENYNSDEEHTDYDCEIVADVTVCTPRGEKELVVLLECTEDVQKYYDRWDSSYGYCPHVVITKAEYPYEEGEYDGILTATEEAKAVADVMDSLPTAAELKRISARANKKREKEWYKPTYDYE